MNIRKYLTGYIVLIALVCIVAAGRCDTSTEDMNLLSKQAIATDLYDPTTRTYRVAKFESGKYSQTDLNVWYADMQAQLWPALFGVVPPNAINVNIRRDRFRF